MRNPKKAYWWAAALILAASTMAVVLLRDRHEVIYQNHSVAYWTEQLSNADPKIRTEAVAALNALGQSAIPALDESVRRKRWDFQRPLASASHMLPRNVVSALHRFLRRDEARARRLNAIRGLEMLGQNAAPAIPALEVALKDSDVSVSTAAAAALARIGPKAVPALTHGLTERNSTVQANACYGLSLMGPLAKGAIPELWRVCERDMGGIGLQACDCLGNIREAAAPFLVKQLDGSDPRLRGLAARALGMMGPYAQEAVSALVRHAKDRDNTTRARVIHALVNIQPSNPAAGGVLLRSLNDSEREIRLDALRGLMGSPRAVRLETPLVIQALADNDATIRGEAARVLGQLGANGTNVISELTKLLDDPDMQVRQSAEKALETIKLSSNR